MKWRNGSLLVMLALGGCHKPLSSLAEASGCYFENGPTWLFRLNGNRVIDHGGTVLATASLAKNGLALVPGIRISDDAHKETIIVSGTEIKRLAAWTQGSAVHLVGFDGFGPEEFARRACD